MSENPTTYVAGMRARGSFLDIITANPHIILGDIYLLPCREGGAYFTPLGLTEGDWEYYRDRCTVSQESLSHLVANGLLKADGSVAEAERFVDHHPEMGYPYPDSPIYFAAAEITEGGIRFYGPGYALIYFSEQTEEAGRGLDNFARLMQALGEAA